jgi:2-phosphosulfolactate phosphatase
VLLDVVLTPSLLGAHDELPPPGRTIYIVVDVIRATTTMSVQLEQGCRRIFVAGSIAEARRACAALAASSPADLRPLLAGESRGLAPEGFDHGNSPAEYAALDLSERDIVFATTNGTRALHACVGGAFVLAGALRNASAVAEAAVTILADQAWMAEPPTCSAAMGDRQTAAVEHAEPSEALIRALHAIEPAAICVVCGGRGALPAYDDTICAGLIVMCAARYLAESGIPHQLGEGARIAAAASAHASRTGLPEALGASDAARAVAAAGLTADLDWCAAVDTTKVVPWVAGTTEMGLLIVEQWQKSK